jgi:hypothetical protein
MKVLGFTHTKFHIILHVAFFYFPGVAGSYVECSKLLLIRCSNSPLLASDRGGPGSITDRDMKVLGTLV